MLGKPRGPNQTPIYLGRFLKDRTFEGRTRYVRLDPEDTVCFSPSIDAPKEGEAFCYGPVTRNKSAKSGQKMGVL